MHKAFFVCLFVFVFFWVFLFCFVFCCFCCFFLFCFFFFFWGGGWLFCCFFLFCFFFFCFFFFFFLYFLQAPFFHFLQDKRCQCKPGFLRQVDSMRCRRRLVGESCSADEDCSSRVLCKGVCTCPIGQMINTAAPYRCLPLRLTSHCEWSKDCDAAVKNRLGFSLLVR